MLIPEIAYQEAPPTRDEQPRPTLFRRLSTSTPSKPRRLVVLSLRLSEDSTLLQHTTGPLLHWPAPPPEPWLGWGAPAAEVLVALSLVVVGVHAGALLLGGAGSVEDGAGQVGEGEGVGVGVSEGGHGAGAARAARAERRSAERANLNCMVIIRVVENEGVQGA